jgi:SPP1 gp7 family putative phage head morphogenesis protein
MAIDPKKQLLKTPVTSNEQYFDALIRHQIHLIRMAGSVSNRVVDLLNKNEKDIVERVKRAMRFSTKGPTPANLRRAIALQKEIEEIRKPMWQEIQKIWDSEMKDLTKEEVLFLSNAMQTVLPVLITPNTPPFSVLVSLVNNNPFDGKTLKEWGKHIEQSDLNRITDSIRIGIAQGEGTNTIARRVIGTAALRGQDGTTQITRKAAIGITRTAVTAFSNLAKRDFYKANADIIEQELYSATLDGVTTAICRSLDGELFPLGVGPIPPLHFNCRSLRVAVLDGTVLGSRPSVPITEKGLVREFTKQNNLALTSSRARLPRGTKGAFDRFARERAGELIGQVPAKVSYQEWLTKQSNTFQDDVLGVTKARLFRKGGLTLDKFVNRRGDELTLSELATKDKQAFINAGLDPKNF